MLDNRTYISPSLVKLMRSRAQEILFEGPARTGKSYGLCLDAKLLMETFPGIKVLFVRQTRKSLNHSVLTLWEDILGRDHPALLPRKQKRARDEYVFPYEEREIDGVWYKGQSEVHLIGMDNPERLMSTEYDVIMVFEATELSLRSWSLAFSRLSNAHMPWNFQVADCNPGPATHWLNMRANEWLMDGDKKTDQPKMYRICTTLKDNPKMWDPERECWTPVGIAYNQKLDNLPPIERKRLRDGLWVSQSGQVYENWRPDKHIVQGKLARPEGRGGRWWLLPTDVDGLTPDFEARPVEYFIAAQDWGYFPDPGAAALYAVDDHQRAFVVDEFYATKKAMDWWAKKHIAWQKRYDVRAIICDVPEEKVVTLNSMLGGKLNSRGTPIAQVAKKGPGSVLAGIDIVRFCLDDDEEGEPRLRYLATAPRLEDQYLREEMLPTGGAQEYPGYVFVEREDGKPNKDLPVDKDNHGLDRDRYAMSYLWRNKHYAPEPEPEKLGPLDIDIAADMAEIQRQHHESLRR